MLYLRRVSRLTGRPPNCLRAAMHTRHVNFPMHSELAVVAAAASFIFQLAIFQGQFAEIYNYYTISQAVSNICCGPRDIYAKLLLFIDSRVPWLKLIQRRKLTAELHNLLLLLSLSTNLGCVAIQIYHSSLLSKQKMSR